MKIGLFGGSFNPPHKGHLYLAETCASALGLDRVLIIPSNIAPHKSSVSYASGEDRLNMCRIAFDSPLFEVSGIELDRGSTSYTVDTLRELRKIYPDDELYFIIGSDMLESFTKWYLWETILELCTLCAAPREKGFIPDFSPYTPEQRKKIVYLDFEPLEISSTEIRIRLKSNNGCEELVDKKVIDYIRSHGLYDDGFDSYREIMTRMLDETRLYHCECVSEAAGELAALYGADTGKAKLAGLLHDITKMMSAQEHLSLIGDGLTPLERSNHKVWHQMSAPVFLRNNGIVTDEEILSAIRWHTTGKADMTLLEKIVYTADFISADRDYPDVDTVRKLSKISLEHAMLYTSRYTVRDLTEHDRCVHPSTLDCYNSMIEHFMTDNNNKVDEV